MSTPSIGRLRRTWRRTLSEQLLLLPLLLLPLGAQQKPVLAPAEYGRFETIAGDAISPNGQWYAYRISKTDADGELRYRRVDRDDSTRVVPLGTAPVFTRDSRLLGWFEEVSIKEREKLTREKKPIQQNFILMTLATGERKKFDAVRASAFSPNGRFVALQGYAPTEIKGKGAALRIVDLGNGSEVSFGDVGEFRWSDEGGLLAMTVATGAANANGIQIYESATGRLRSLENSGSNYHAITWRKGSSDLALFRSIAPAGTDKPGEVILAWRAVTTSGPHFTLAKGPAFADSLEIVDFSALRWSNDGNAIAFGLRPKAPAADTGKKANADSASTVQIWRSSDVQIPPMQQSRAAGLARRTLLSVWYLGDHKVVQLGSKLNESASLMEGWRQGTETLAEPYEKSAMFGRSYSDVYLVDATTGAHTKVFDKVRYNYESGDGRYLLSYDGKDYWSYEIATGKRTNLTVGLKTSFANTKYDTPTDILPPYGTGGWFAGDSAVLLYDEYDIWKVSPDGARREKLTSGRAEEIVHRVQRLSFDTPTLDPKQPLTISLSGDRDEKSGYARLMPDGRVARLVYADKAIRGLRKADSAEVYAYRAEDRADSPDTFVADAEFKAPRQVTSTNTFLPQYAWTHEELIAFKSEGGVPLKGVLLYPVNYDASKKYPMIVYTYEMLSDQLHSWQAPSERSYYNFTVWTMNGYFVLMPDIVFKAREPGISTVQSVRAAVKSVVDRGFVDPKRVGHIGHSWGGYEAAYLGTHGGDFLATTIAGASITDLVSFMGQIHWNGGNPESSHSETGQARMQVPFWEDPAAHERNSAIHNVQNMKIPMLMAHGNKDGTVEFFQATEFYNFARRAGKDVVLLVYDGEDHGFSKKANQIDYHRRILEWFGHYLKGEPAPSWITNGIKAGEIAAEAKRVADKGMQP